MNASALTWRLLTTDELEQLYLNDMRRDFPVGELKPLSTLLNSNAAGVSHTWGVYDGDALAAYLSMVRPTGSKISQLDYFAVVPAYRAAGLGAQLLASLPAHEPGADVIIIESENPNDALDFAIARRRLGFYSRCGAVDTGWLECLFGSWFRVLRLNCGAATPDTEDTIAALTECYRSAMGHKWQAYVRFYAPGERTRELRRED